MGSDFKPAIKIKMDSVKISQLNYSSIDIMFWEV